MNHHIFTVIFLSFGFLTSVTGCRKDVDLDKESSRSEPIHTAEAGESSNREFRVNWPEAEKLITSTEAEVSLVIQSVGSIKDIERGQDKIDYLMAKFEFTNLTESEQELIRQRAIKARTQAANHFQNLTAESYQNSAPADFVRQQIGLSAWASNVGI